MNRKLISQSIIAKRIHKESFKSLKRVIALEGYHDDGKTSVLKMLIAELYRRDSESWKKNKKYDPKMVKISGSQCKGDYSAVFCYKGVFIAITTGGDNPSVLAENFEFFARYHAVVGITAVKVNAENETFLAATAFEQAELIIGFKSRKIDIRSRKLRDEQSEMLVVDDIIKALDLVVSEVKKETSNE